MKNLLKKSAVLFSIIFLLTGCFGSDSPTIDSNTADTSNKILYENNLFSVLVPKDWEILEKDDFISQIPENIVVNFRNNLRNEIFTANVNISVKEFSEDVSSLDFAKSIKNLAEKNLVEFQELEFTEINLLAGGKEIPAVSLKFQGKNEPKESVIIFKQIACVYQKTGFTLTSAYLPNEDTSVITFIDEMVASFQLK